MERTGKTKSEQAEAEARIRGRICFIMRGRLSAGRLRPGWRDKLTQRDIAGAQAIINADRDTDRWIAARIRQTVRFPEGWFTQAKQESCRLSPGEFAAKEAQRWLWENRVLADRLLGELMRSVFLAGEMCEGGLRAPDVLASLRAELGSGY